MNKVWSKNIVYLYFTYITGFVNLKIWTFALLLIKTQNRHFQKHLAPKFIENFSLPICYKITQKMFIFWLKKWRKMIITVISYGLPLGTNFVNTYMSLCWSNLYFMANAPGGHGPYYFKYKSLLKVSLFTLFNNMWKQKLVLIENIKSVSVPTF